MENEFKLPSVKEDIKKKEAQVESQENQTVVVEVTAPCYVNMVYRTAGIRFMVEKKIADQLVNDGCAFIVY